MARLALVVAGIATMWLGLESVVAAAPPQTLAVSANYGRFTIDEETAPRGGVLNVEYERFFSDAMALYLGAGGGYFFADENGYTAHAVAGFSYTLDNLKYVPYGTVGVGGLLVSDERVDPGLGLYVQGGGGLDVRLNRRLAVGVTARFEVRRQRVSLFTMGARIVWRWGEPQR